MRYALAVAALIAGSAHATEVYSTFNTDEQNLFDCCNVIPIAGNHASAEKASVAIPFTPAAFAKITEVDVALSRIDPGDLMIEIAGSTMGLPGRVKKSWTRLPPAGGQCCEYVAVTSGQAVHAAAGGHYWIIIEGKKHAVGGWNLNTLGLSGPYAVLGVDRTWSMTEGPLPAVRIIAK